MSFCTKCGAKLNEGQKFCTSCGTANDGFAAEPVGSVQPPVYNADPAPKASTWDGGVFETVINSIAASLIITFTCGIATPWAICYMIRFIVSHAVIDGKRLVFTGTGGSLFGNWIKWFLLTIITCGIYGFWVTPRLYRWIASNIHEA